jgi:hypothetical protein
MSGGSDVDGDQRTTLRRLAAGRPRLASEPRLLALADGLTNGDGRSVATRPAT